MSRLFPRILYAAALIAGATPFPASAQTSAAELLLRLERLENQIRQLTGAVEELQYRNQQLEQQIRRAGHDPGPQPAARPQAPPAAVPMRRSEVFEAEDNVPPTGTARPQGPVIAGAGAARSAPTSGPRRDVFDPDQNPHAPGAPRALGSAPTFVGTPPPDRDPSDGPIGAPGGRAAGAPLDLSTLSGPDACRPRPRA